MPEQLDQPAAPTASEGAIPSPEPSSQASSGGSQPNSTAQTHPETHNRPQDAAQDTQPTTPMQTSQEAGNMQQASPAARDGPESSAKQYPSITLARGPDGKLYNPAKGPPPPKDPRLGEKAQSAVLLNSPKPSEDNDLEKRDTRIGGLSDIPKGWKELPSNVSLGVEVAWVQAERLRVVIETPRGGIKVDLSKARSPAPSMAALSWLETSIRSYAKFVEVAAKQASSGQDEAEFVRKERMALAEIRGILEEMKDAGKE